VIGRLINISVIVLIMVEQSFSEVISQIMSIVKRFNKIEGKPWGAEGTMIELMKQVGELSKLVMVQEGFYYPDRKNEDGYLSNKELIGDELADILLAIIRLANHYGIDLEKANLEARKEEDRFLKTKNI